MGGFCVISRTVRRLCSVRKLGPQYEYRKEVRPYETSHNEWTIKGRVIQRGRGRVRVYDRGGIWEEVKKVSVNQQNKNHMVT